MIESSLLSGHFVFKLFKGSVFKGGLWYTGETFHSPLVEKYDKNYNL